MEKAKVQYIDVKNKNGIRLYIKREDELYPHISGNKYRKLKYNLEEAKTKKYKTLLTFGGAFSNHISATAYAGKLHDFKTIGVIRGDELKHKAKLNPTLKFAVNQGMRLHYVSREDYRLKSDAEYIKALHQKLGDFYLIPEGGTNPLAIKGCEEILNLEDETFDYICCAVGTGGTISGLINASKIHQTILGFPALKGDFLKDEIRKFVKNENWKLITNYHFGGYAKIDETLVDFINTFKTKYGIGLDPIYTAKVAFGIIDLMENDFFKKQSKILMIHTGGLQGIEGMNTYLKAKALPLINI